MLRLDWRHCIVFTAHIYDRNVYIELVIEVIHMYVVDVTFVTLQKLVKLNDNTD